MIEDVSVFNFSLCTSCENGFRFFEREKYSPECDGTTTVFEICDYACSNLTEATSANAVLITLQREFQKGLCLLLEFIMNHKKTK